MKLDQLIGSIATTTVRVGGLDVTLRMLTDGQAGRLSALFPPPMPPLVPDPERGNVGVRVADFDDPAYLAGPYRVHRIDSITRELVVSMGLEDDHGAPLDDPDDARARERIAALTTGLRSRFDPRVMSSLREAYLGMFRAGADGPDAGAAAGPAEAGRPAAGDARAAG